MHIHGNGVELFQAGHSPQEKDNDSSSFNSFNGSTEQVRSKGLKVLENEHLEGITQYFMRLFIVGIPDLGGADEQFEWIVNILVVQSLHLHVFDLFDAFLLVAGELKFGFVAP